MDNWVVTLLIKPFAAIGVLVGLWLIFRLSRGLMRLIRPLWPEGKLKRLLFDDGRQGSATDATGSGKSIL